MISRTLGTPSRLSRSLSLSLSLPLAGRLSPDSNLSQVAARLANLLRRRLRNNCRPPTCFLDLLALLRPEDADRPRSLLSLLLLLLPLLKPN